MVKEIEIVKPPDSWDDKTHTKLANKEDLVEIAKEENQDIKYVRESVQHEKGRKIEDGGFFGSDKYEWTFTADNIYFVEKENEVLYYRTRVAEEKFPQNTTCKNCGKTIPNEEESYSPIRGEEGKEEIMSICADCRDEITGKLSWGDNPVENRRKVINYVYSD